MKFLSAITAIFTLTLFTACAQKGKAPMTTMLSELPPVIHDPAKYNKLTPEEERIIQFQCTERPFTGAYAENHEAGVYICRRCNNPLFTSDAKFESGSGWPSFDEYIPGSVKEVPDKDGSRTEIRCANCDGHIGHVFFGEGFTDKDTRNCANSASLNFVPASAMKQKKDTDVQPIGEYIKGKGLENYSKATFAGGCFWCSEASFDRINGVVAVISGYTGGDEQYPTYEEVSDHQTHHAEAVMVYFDPKIVSYEKLLEVFFVAHNPTELNRQGPDVGEQYRSAIFYHDEAQRKAAEAEIQHLTEVKKYPNPIVTEVSPYKEFWVAEGYHQDYYDLNPNQPYIQHVSKPKVEKVEKTFPDIIKKVN